MSTMLYLIYGIPAILVVLIWLYKKNEKVNPPLRFTIEDAEEFELTPLPKDVNTEGNEEMVFSKPSQALMDENFRPLPQDPQIRAFLVEPSYENPEVSPIDE